MPHKVFKNKGTIDVYTNDAITCNGLDVRDALVALIKKEGSKQHYTRTHEWCSGNGAIGFNILSNKLTDQLVLTDKFEPAVQCTEFTISANEIDSCVTTYCTDSISKLPKTEKWDLFVANPPWRKECSAEIDPNCVDTVRKAVDPNWETHSDLWKNIKKHMTLDGDIFILECDVFSDPEVDFGTEIKNNGLQIKNVFRNLDGIHPSFYVIHIIIGP